MPIRFRCSYCNRLLGIATRKAGTQTRCPHCGNEITVPVPNEDDAKTERMDLDDVDQLLRRGDTEVMSRPAVATAPPPSAEKRTAAAAQAKAPTPSSTSNPHSAPPPIPKPVQGPAPSDERPLFEKNVDEILGKTVVPAEPARVKRPATSGMDALSLDQPPGPIVLSAKKATLLMIVVVVLMALAFAAGYFLAPKA
jgi:phage FluMu protein Com